MKRRHLAIGIGVVSIVAFWQLQSAPALDTKDNNAADTDSQRKHGEYLVNGATLCGDCHTPHDDQGKPDRKRFLRGASIPVRPKKETKKWADEAPDITSSGLAGKWSEDEMVKFLTTGEDPDGMKARPPMPPFRLNAGDARAVALYLKSLPNAKVNEEPRQNKTPR